MAWNKSLAQKLLFTFSPENAHSLAIAALKMGLIKDLPAINDPRLRVKLWDLDFPNPLGMAAGFDKNAEVPDALLRLGFGAAEVGTLTPLAQPGNPKPRMFRLAKDEAVINRLGFNNEGHAPALHRLEQRKGNGGIVGVNVGANKDSEDRSADYVKGIETFASLASYFTINISSPNTPGLRDLQAREALDDLLGRCMDKRNEVTASAGRSVPVLLKIAPDVTEFGLDDICAVAIARGVDGMIVSNTTLDRYDSLKDVAQKSETGGLSGKPLFEKATIALAKTRQRVGPDMPLVGVGGVHDGISAIEKIRAGANLVQFYSSLVYGGPGMVRQMLVQMADYLSKVEATSLEDIRGQTTADWAAKELTME
ncbi:MAG: quinone-dependent dihydroorotate dehydrogenase [Cohaesibacter sp.]|jgi:dihydroorotate dehydrogenase|nr:quinone-dependent dihydroorotate dehydrogenase [Cohaesibacter sp.]